jgi:hypothetical protein
MTSKLINLLAISSLAILACNYGPTPVNALSGEVHSARHIMRSHNTHFLKKKKRSAQRCKAKAPAPNQAAAQPDAQPVAQPDTQASTPAPPTDQGQQNGGNNTSGNQPSTDNNSPPPANTQPQNTQPQNNPPQNSAPSSPPSGGSSKFCLAWPNGLTGDAAKDLQNFNRGKNNKVYTWSPDHTAVDGFDVLPMLWGFNQVGQFQQQVNPSNAHTILGMNEPNQSGQSDMSPQDGCGLWQQNIEPLRQQGLKAGCPATTSAPSGIQWVKDFMAAGCKCDFVPLHWYDIRADDFIAYVTNFHNTFNLPIWVTEYAAHNFNGGAQPSDAEVWNLHTTVKGWMDSVDFVHTYCPFGAMRDMQGVTEANRLMKQDGTPTDLAFMYLNGQ